MARKEIEDDHDACDAACHAAVDRWNAAHDLADTRRKARKAAAKEQFDQAIAEPLRLHDLRMASASDKYRAGRAPFQAQFAQDWTAFFEQADRCLAAVGADVQESLTDELSAEEDVLSASHSELTKNVDAEFVAEKDAAVREIQAVCKRLAAVRKAESDLSDAEYEEAMRPVGEILNAECAAARKLHTPRAFANSQTASSESRRK